MTLEAKLQTILDDHVARGVVGMSLALSRPGRDLIQLTSGYADRFEKTPMRPDHLFRIASCTKTFIAAGLHLLVEDGVVDFEAPISRWFPDLPKADQMPVRILLNHRSGLPDFETVMPMISDKTWTGEEIVRFAFEHGTPQREPWHGMSYSNTGYVLAGLIIERETGRPYAEHLRRRIFEPLGLTDTWVGTYEAYPAERIARAYMHDEGDANGQWDVSGAGKPIDGVWDATAWFPLSGANAAGDIVSTPRDAVAFLDALFDGRLIGLKQLGEMKDNLTPATFPGSRIVANGHGMLVSRYGDIDAKGHLGQLPGHTSMMGRDEASGVTLMLIQNSGAGAFTSFYLEGINEPAAKILSLARSG